MKAVHEVEHGVGVAQSLGGDIKKLDARLSSLVSPTKVFVDLLDQAAGCGARHVSGRYATTRSLEQRGGGGETVRCG